jgi:hypothetical protein
LDINSHYAAACDFDTAIHSVREVGISPAQTGLNTILDEESPAARHERALLQE